MDIKCFVRGCDIPPSLCCYCSSKATALCHNHIPDHIQKYPNLVHNYKSIYKILTPDTKKQISKSLHSKLDVLKNEIQSFNTFVSNIFLKVQMIAKVYYTQKKIMENVCKKMLKEINENNVASMLFRRDHNDVDQVSLEDIENEIERRFKTIYTKNKNSFDKLSNKLMDECTQLKSYLNKSNYIEFGKSIINNTCIYLFQQNTKDLIKFDTRSLQKTSETIKINSNQGHNAATCYIPGNKLFVSGGISNTTLSTTFLIDLTSKLVENLKEVRQRSHTTGIYINNKVFIFGGYNGNSDLNTFDAFNMNTKKWEQLASMPKTVCYTSVLELNDKFLIVGRYNLILTYDWNLNSYNEVTNQLTIDSYSILIKDNRKIHLLHENKVYISSEDDIKTFKSIALVGIFSFNTCLPVVKGRIAYFADFKCTIYQYNLDSHRLDTIA